MDRKGQSLGNEGRWIRAISAMLLLACIGTVSQTVAGEATTDPQWGRWENLLDERYRKQWEIIDVAKGRGHGGKSSVKDGRALLSGLKNRVTGRWRGQFPTMDYEVVFEVARTAGVRFR